MITRKTFLGLAAGGTVALLQACGGDSNDHPAPASCGASGVEISNNHGHALVVPVADLSATTDKTYTIVGTSNHDHTVRLTAAQFEVLRTGGSVTVTSSTEFSHGHQVTAGCA
jgi:hypothetical protein